VFNINRIGYVEILEDQPWKHTTNHKTIKVDVFHMTGDSTSRISLQLDLMAKNLLIVVYPKAKDFITGQKGDENVWYFNTDICRIEGIGRFYIGLAGHIQILEGDELKKYATEYARKYLIC
jgi:predicted DNA-binding transcriptional regulator YafY